MEGVAVLSISIHDHETLVSQEAVERISEIPTDPHHPGRVRVRSGSGEVDVLDIRSRQYDSLQKELRNLEDREQRSRGYLASQQNKLEHFKLQISETVDEAQRSELEEKRDQTTVYIENLKEQMEHFAQRRADLQSRIILLEQRTREVESIVDDWLEELATRSNDSGE